MSRFLKPFFVRAFFVIVGIFVLVFPYQAISVQAATADTSAQQAALQAQYDSLQQDIAKWQSVLDDTKAKANTLQGDVTYLNAKIKEATLAIQAKNLAIADLSKQVDEKSQAIETLEQRISQGKESLAQLIRQANVLDNYTIVDVILSSQNLSTAFDDLNLFTSIHRSMENDFATLRSVEAATNNEKAVLGQKIDQTTDAKQAVETQKQVVAQTQAEKSQLLTQTKGQAAAYQQIVADKQAKAAQILAALFTLRDAKGVSFSDALKYANFASQKTGVRPALILAILTQESDLGQNQGSCLVTNISTGDGVGKNSGTPFQKVMKAPRDTAPFQAITSRLGLSWQGQVVSCPPGYTWTASRGYGGGMGPSQFIPSTWELFKARIGAMVGVSADQANPWNPEHAFVATGIYLSDLGASAGTYTAERNAACKYYSGASCQPGRSPANTFYGDEVMQKAGSIQNNIDFLSDTKAQSGQ